MLTKVGVTATKVRVTACCASLRQWPAVKHGFEMAKVGIMISVITKVSVTAIAVLTKVSVTACKASLRVKSASQLGND